MRDRARAGGARARSTTVVDSRPPGGGATQASAGMLAPYIEAHDRGPLLDLGIRSLGLYDEWIAEVARESGLDVEYRRIGTLEVALDPDHAEQLQRTPRTLREPVRTLDGRRDQARAGHAPALGTLDLRRTLHRDPRLRAAHQLTHALARRRAAGARFPAGDGPAYRTSGELP